MEVPEQRRRELNNNKTRCLVKGTATAVEYELTITLWMTQRYQTTQQEEHIVSCQVYKKHTQMCECE